MKKLLFLVFAFLLGLIALAGCTQSPVSPTVPAGNMMTTSMPNTDMPGTGVTGSTQTGSSSSISNGRRIYFYAIDNNGNRITYTGGSGMMMQGSLACVTCHGTDGHGGRVNFMMQSYDVPNITWTDLTGPDPDMEHPPYTEETLKRAITQGLDPGGGQLEYPMPRWQMSEQDLNDLVGFIQTLK